MAGKANDRHGLVTLSRQRGLVAGREPGPAGAGGLFLHAN
jgi:hypothetical protein